MTVRNLVTLYRYCQSSRKLPNAQPSCTTKNSRNQAGNPKCKRQHSQETAVQSNSDNFLYRSQQIILSAVEQVKQKSIKSLKQTISLGPFPAGSTEISTAKHSSVQSNSKTAFQIFIAACLYSRNPCLRLMSTKLHHIVK